MEYFDLDFFVTTFQESPIAQIVVDDNGRIKLFNRAAENLFKYDAKDVYGEPIDILVPQGTRSVHGDLVKLFFRHSEPRDMGKGRDLFGVDKNGKMIPIEVGLNPILNRNSTFVMASIVDISERLKSQQHFKNAIEAAPNAMIMVDSHGTITMVNRQGEAMFGYSRQEMLGQKIEMLVPFNVRHRHPHYVSSFIRKPEPRAMGIGRELYGQKKDGVPFPVEVGLMPLETEEGISVISSVVDISERVSNQKALMARNEELQQFAYRTSHDLKAPLRSIAGLTKFISEDCQAGRIAEALKNIEKVQSLSQKLLSFITDILNLTRADYAQEEVSSWDVVDTLNSIRTKLSAMTETNQIEFRHLLGHSIAPLGDTTRFSQILENLISNAIKYRDQSKSMCFVEITTANDDESFYLDVRDNGVGIPVDRNQEVFQMFKRFHKTSVDGSGLGLYLVKKLTEKSKGHIAFESDANGTCFKLRFPLKLSLSN